MWENIIENLTHVKSEKCSYAAKKNYGKSPQERLSEIGKSRNDKTANHIKNVVIFSETVYHFVCYAYFSERRSTLTEVYLWHV